VIEAVKANKKKGKGKGKGKGNGNVADTNGAATFVQPPQGCQQTNGNSGTRWSAQLPSSRSQLSWETATGDGGRASPYRQEKGRCVKRINTQFVQQQITTPAPRADHLLSFTFARMQRHKRQRLRRCMTPEQRGV
jgi:hypothetical protein